MVPFPAVDALLEICQKGVCVGLMGLYCYSPMVATIINLLLLSICALLFGWVVRKTAYYRHLIVSPLLAWLLPAWFAQRETSFTAFCEQAVGGLPRLARFTIHQNSATNMKCVEPGYGALTCITSRTLESNRNRVSWQID